MQRHQGLGLSPPIWLPQGTGEGTEQMDWEQWSISHPVELPTGVKEVYK